MKIHLLFICLLSPLFWLHADPVYTVNTVPNPKEVNNTYVSDPAHVLKAATIDQINTQLAVLEQVSSDQIAIVVLPSISDESPKEFATDLFARFKIGQKKKDNGLLILMVMDKHRVEFETGYGMESILPDMICKRIEMDYMVPRFKEGNYDQGLLDGLAEVNKILANPESIQEFAGTPAVDEEDTSFTQVFLWILGGIYLLIIVIVFFVKKSKGTFLADMSDDKQLYSPLGRWVFFYVFVPLLLYGFLNNSLKSPDYVWLFLGSMYVFVLVLLLERKQRCMNRYRAHYAEGNYYNQYNNHLKYLKGWQTAVYFFPFPFLFTDFNHKGKLKALRNHPRECKSCSSPMQLLDEDADDQYLKKQEVFEENLKSVDYDVWMCTTCHQYEALSYSMDKSVYSVCPDCHTKAYYIKSDRIIQSATTYSSGSGEKISACKYCLIENVESYIIPQVTESSSSGSSGSSSDSGSFGGGSSGGGGAGSDW